MRFPGLPWFSFGTMNDSPRNSQSRWRGGRSVPQPPLTPPEPPLSRFSTKGVRDSTWCSLDMLLGAGMVIIQQNTHKVVVVYETKRGYWFFPRGRKDVGESLETAALREAYEESGYRAQFLPLFNPTHQPPPPNDPEAHVNLNTEPIGVTTKSWQPKRSRQGQLVDHGGEYLTMWYVGQIEEDAIKEIGTGMWDEQDYESHLLDIDDALTKVWGQEHQILEYVWAVYVDTMNYLANQQEQNTSTTSETDRSPDQ